MKTASEKFFEDFCEKRGVRWKRVAETNVRTPDYDIYVPRRKIVVEVKEITSNKEEKRAEKEISEKGSSIISVTPGHRVRKKISTANAQIKNRTKKRYPGMLVLFQRGLAADHIDPYQIRVAMYGFETVQYAVPKDPKISPYPVGAKFGARRKMTAEHNTSISAIGALYSSGRGAIDLTVYHNDYANTPLDPSLLCRYKIRQFRLEQSTEGAIPDWEEIK